MASRWGSLFLPVLLCHSGPLRPFKHSETLYTKSKLTARCCYSGSFLRTPPLPSSSPALRDPSSLSVLGTFLSYDPSRQTLACSAAQSKTSALTIASRKESHRKKNKKPSKFPYHARFHLSEFYNNVCLAASELSQHTRMRNEHQSSSIRIWPFCDVIKKTDKCPTHLLDPPTQTAFFFLFF